MIKGGGNQYYLQMGCMLQRVSAIKIKGFFFFFFCVYGGKVQDPENEIDLV